MSERCQHADTVAVYLLGALPDDDRAQFEAHLATCPRCREDVAALGRVVDALPAAAPPTAAPAELRARVLATVRAEADVLHAAGATADASPPARRGFLHRIMPPRRLALAGACGLVLAALVGYGLRSAVEPGQVTTTRTVEAAAPTRTVVAQIVPSTAPKGTARIVLRGGVATLEVAGLPAPPPGKVYEVWLVPRGRTTPAPTNALFSVDRRGSGRVALPNVRDVATVLVTAEPDGGSPAPTSQPFLSATL
jgi:anti-sigma factor RsiW